ncbi:DUF2931 family protein [Flavobacterium chryseum]|uniref:DUF2931 family protein n=1 Tax=Flavobacterium sp. P3160 TaxID=2512113 RepID=UPI00105DD2C9|nr:DUF2931 family protein [Flavobacterium sp. P3160]TDO82981.1 DUF2931 family protein [Flavobacterium sp. P3160]
MCHPEDKYLIEVVNDKVKTLEGVSASFPYGGSSGEWGDSHASWTEQNGTPIGADVTYYAGYEDTFYRLNVDFPVDTIVDLSKRFYCNNEDLEYGDILKEYVYERKPNQRAYTEFRDLVFGFAPKGVVVVWLRYGATQKELGRYQAEVVKDNAALEKKLFASWSMNREEVRENYLAPYSSPEKWDNYRKKYVWHPVITSDNSKFKLFDVMTGFFNAESEIAVRPISLNPAKRERAIPSAITFFWETGKGEKYEGRAFFNWEKTNEKFKNEDNGDNEIQIKVNNGNRDFEVLLNGKSLETVNKRVYLSNQEFKDSYK